MKIDLTPFRAAHGVGPGFTHPVSRLEEDRFVFNPWVFKYTVGGVEREFSAPGSEGYTKATQSLRAYLARNFPGQKLDRAELRP